MIVEAMPYVAGSLAAVSLVFGFGWHSADKLADFWRDQQAETDAMLTEASAATDGAIARLVTANTLVTSLTENQRVNLERIETLSNKVAKLEAFRVKRNLSKAQRASAKSLTINPVQKALAMRSQMKMATIRG